MEDMKKYQQLNSPERDMVQLCTKTNYKMSKSTPPSKEHEHALLLNKPYIPLTTVKLLEEKKRFKNLKNAQIRNKLEIPISIFKMTVTQSLKYWVCVF